MECNYLFSDLGDNLLDIYRMLRTMRTFPAARLNITFNCAALFFGSAQVVGWAA